MAKATQMSHSTVRAGVVELKTPRRGSAALPPERIRRPGGDAAAHDQRPAVAARTRRAGGADIAGRS